MFFFLDSDQAKFLFLHALVPSENVQNILVAHSIVKYLLKMCRLIKPKKCLNILQTTT